MTLSSTSSGEFEGRLACITGSSRGVGFDIATRLAHGGARVVLVGRQAEHLADAARILLETTGHTPLLCEADMGEKGALAHGLAGIGVDPNEIEILVCAAGISLPHRPFWEYDDADYRRCFDLNVLGVQQAASLVVQGMMRRKAGRIIAIGGTYGYRGVARSAFYSASKWALRGLIKSIAMELGSFGITANIVSPGGVDGDNLRAQFARSAEREGMTFQAVYDRFAARSCMHELVTGEDVAEMVRFLASDAAGRITGQDMLVDAGTVI